ncbi:BhlA/UviB family holin-like peptide [Fictibacillus phosphorivorans]|uniref:BhlA/UviB family holin-like peptide n=1 Tax=Fictibacillus phosphorivorans TaxID=1221500 RepID=UPI00203AD773|nr:BhlA/UviB family holin-like peptide [Fictibacillus phosphorivorans]MCM3719165.1 BhlA/UviB family holin-like peptide [Fictibacillus phosphorivorans]MCM3776787.1 BhlA/UviB family holin-like peptide [Fictibacillus phosphorivorans]
MEFSIPVEMVASQGIFACLFVYLLLDTRKESKQREEKLTVQIEKQNESMDRIVQSIERLEEKVSNIKGA